MITRTCVFRLATLAFFPLAFANQERRVLSPRDNIGQTIKAQHSNGNEKARFAIHADIVGLGTEIAFDVVEPENPAVTPDTILRHGGNESPIGNDVLHTLLVSDLTTANGAATFALLAVNPANDDVHGIVEAKGSKPYKISQSQGKNQGKATAETVTDLIPPDWSCGVHEQESIFDRRLESESEGEHEHHHQDLEHHHDHESVDSAMESLSKQLRGVKVNPLNKPRRLQTTTYNFQVDLFIEIDQLFITKSGGTMSTALNYINALVTAANIVYEKEIDTHLHVSYVVLTSYYDASTSTSNALSTMVSTYGAGTWHTPGIDLHHALLGKALGGGIAYLAVLCRSDYGYGLTASIGGTFVSLDYKVVWDLNAFMHEIGHNFASGHTHDGYTPVIDTCGTSCPATGGVRWATLMSYCHLCPGNYGNIMYTFGGVYDGSGTKSDIANWVDNPVLVANYDATHSSVDPRREAHKMYSHASTRGSCLSVPVVQTPQPTRSPTTPVPTNHPVTSAPVTLPPTKTPVTSSPVTPQPTKNPTTQAPTKMPTTQAPTTKTPTKAPITQAPTPITNCDDPSITQQQCNAAPNCVWVKNRGKQFCQFSSNPPQPSPPSGPTTPKPTKPVICDPPGTTCDAKGANNCCNGCQANGRWANTCK